MAGPLPGNREAVQLPLPMLWFDWTEHCWPERGQSTLREHPSFTPEHGPRVSGTPLPVSKLEKTSLKNQKPPPLRKTASGVWPAAQAHAQVCARAVQAEGLLHSPHAPCKCAQEAAANACTSLGSSTSSCCSHVGCRLAVLETYSVTLSHPLEKDLSFKKYYCKDR